MTLFQVWFRRVSLLCLAVAACSGSVFSAQAGDFRGSAEEQFRLWGAIPFIAGADFAEYSEVYSQNRSDVRGQLVRDFTSMMKAVKGSNTPSAQTVQVVTDALLTFDKLYEVHRDYARQGLPESLEIQFRSALDRRYYEERVATQKVRFVNLVDMNEIIRAINQRSSARLSPQLPEVDLVGYGVYTSLGGSLLRLDLTLVKLSTGESVSFSATDEIGVVAAKLAKEVFTYFQTNQYGSWKNPQKKLSWLLPAPGHRLSAVEPQVARAVCESQGARLPYAQELVMADAAGLFHSGGVALQLHQRYHVADQTRWSGNHFYYTVTGDPRGHVRTSAGSGSELAPYFCVIGEANAKIQRVEKIFRAIRYFRTQRGNRAEEIKEAAAECLISEIGSITASVFAADYCDKLTEATPLSAEDFLKQAGIAL